MNNEDWAGQQTIPVMITRGLADDFSGSISWFMKHVNLDPEADTVELNCHNNRAERALAILECSVQQATLASKAGAGS